MPVYPIQETFKGYFYTNKKVNGSDDRVYSAIDMREPINAIYSDGIKPAVDGTVGTNFKVISMGGMRISVSEGYAKVGGVPIVNYAPYPIELDGAISVDRYDAVIIRHDDTDAVRKMSIHIKPLTAPPTVNDLERNSSVYEVCIAYVRIPAFSTAPLTNADIVDTRNDGTLCRVMSGVGAMVVQTFRNTYFSETTNQKDIPIGIEQFDKSRDHLTVIVEGRVFTQDVNYTIKNDETITLDIGLPVLRTKIEFEVTKNVNAAGAETVVLEVEDLLKRMAVAERKMQYDYYCNGVNDNVNISNIVKTYLTGEGYGTMMINVIGTLGMSSPIGGTGASATPYYWFDFNVQSNRRAVVDFSRSTEINPTIENGTYNVIFHSNNGLNIKGANVVASNTATNTVIRVTNALYGAINFEDCRFWITAHKNSLIGLRGTYKNCRGSVANVTENSYCFQPDTNAIIRVIGGEYYAYTGDSSKQSAVVGQSSTDAVTIMYGVNAPTSARSGFYQTNSLLQWVGGGVLCCTDLISALPMTVASGISNIRGTIAKSKPGAM